MGKAPCRRWSRRCHSGAATRGRPHRGIALRLTRQQIIDKGPEVDGCLAFVGRDLKPTYGMATFREVADALGLSAPELAELFGRPAQSIRQMRLDPDHPSCRPPPEGWEKVLLQRVQARRVELRELAEALEKAAGAEQ